MRERSTISLLTSCQRIHLFCLSDRVGVRLSCQDIDFTFAVPAPPRPGQPKPGINLILFINISKITPPKPLKNKSIFKEF